MNDFVAKYKNAQGGAKPRQINKDQKKAVTKALHDSFKMAISGQVAGINHNGVQYLLMKQDIFNDIIKNGGKMLLTGEQKEFNQRYQILMQMMQNMNMENDGSDGNENETDLFTELDSFTFEFSQFMNDPKAAKKRREIIKDFKELIASSELLSKMEVNLLKQMNPKKEEKVENNGKLT